MSRKKNESAQTRHTNKVYQVLRYLDEGERKRFVRFLQSPYFNQSKTMLLLCELLHGALGQSTDHFNRTEVWRRLSSGQPYDDVTFRKHCSDLLKLLEQFMSIEARQRDQIETQLDLMSFVTRKKIEPLYNSVVRQVRQSLEQQSYASQQNYRQRHRLERQYYQMMNFDVSLHSRANLEEISHYLDLYYWIEKLKLYSTALSHRRTGTIQYNLEFVQEVTDYLSKYPVESTPDLAVYYYTYRMLYDEDDTLHYFNFKRTLEQFGAMMPREEAIELYDAALHYCTGKINKGDNAFLQEYFDLFNDAISKEIFMQNGELATWRFNNIMGAALRLGKLDWAESFIERYASYLPAESRENAYTFSMARVYSYQHKYDKVLGLIRNVEYEDHGYNLISKAMLLITYYELDEFDALDSFSESFRVFLNRYKNLSAERRQRYINLIRFVRKLTRLVPGDKAAVQKLRKEIEENRAYTVNHEWLLEKVDELL